MKEESKNINVDDKTYDERKMLEDAKTYTKFTFKRYTKQIFKNYTYRRK